MTTAEVSPADPAVVARLCVEAGEADLARRMIAANLSAAQVTARLEEVAGVRQAVAAAGRVCSAIEPALADKFIAAGARPAHVKKQLLDAIVAAEGPEISTAQTTKVRGAAEGWDKTVAAINAAFDKNQS